MPYKTGLHVPFKAQLAKLKLRHTSNLHCLHVLRFPYVELFLKNYHTCSSAYSEKLHLTMISHHFHSWSLFYPKQILVNEVSLPLTCGFSTLTGTVILSKSPYVKLKSCSSISSLAIMWGTLSYKDHALKPTAGGLPFTFLFIINSVLIFPHSPHPAIRIQL